MASGIGTHADIRHVQAAPQFKAEVPLVIGVALD
jgi:hypothetical protein